MKNLFKRIIPFWMLILSSVSFGQTPEIVTYSSGVITLKGKGKLGGNKDGYQFYQYNTAVSGSFYLQAYFRNLTNKTQSYTGLAFRNIGTYLKSDGGVATVMVVYQNDSLKCLIKAGYNQRAVPFLISANIKMPGYIKLAKEGNDAKFYYSNQPETDLIINWVLLGTYQNVFTGWSNITQNFITGGNLATVQTAVVSKRVYGILGNGLPVPAVPEGNGGTGVVSFTNHLKNIPLETQNDRYSVNAFPIINTKLKPYGTRQIAKYPVVWHSKLDNFISAGRKTWEIGISSPVDIVPNYPNQGGDGVRCVDYIFYADPNTGQPWANGGIDPQCNKTVPQFISARPFEFRVKGDGGSTAPFTNFTNEQLYDEGVKYTSSDKFGYGDNVGNKSNVGLSVSDVENGDHGRFQEIPIAIGMANNTIGYALEMYNQSINIVNPDLSHYPTDYNLGGYVQNRIKLDGTLNLDGNGNIQQNNVINDAWKPQNKVTIPSRGITDKGLIDFENALESSEVSCVVSAAYHQGESINYDDANKSLTRQINKFGINRNTEHIIAHTIYATQVRKWYLRKFFNNRKFFTSSKTLCDRFDIGLTNYGAFGDAWVTNQDLKAKHLPRDLAFMKTMFTAFEGSYFYHWDRNTAGKYIDGNNGDLFAINLINQRKTMSQGGLSFVDLFDDFDFKLWTAEISYDNGSTWKQEKGVDYILNQTSIPHAQCVTSNGIWAVFLARPENTESKSCKLRINYNGVYKYLDVTPAMWETTDPAYANTSLANIPDVGKDYYYNLIDISGQTQNGGGGTATVNPVIINSNPTNPVAGASVNFSTSSACAGTVKWFNADAQVATGLNYTVTSPVAGVSYTATCTVNLVSSVASNVIVINPAPISGVLTITEPNKPAYYFSNNNPPIFYDNVNNLPAIHASSTKDNSNYAGKILSGITMKSNYDPVNDLVWLKNDKIKIGINLLRGGQIAWASLINSNENLVYNGYDGGFQVTADLYQKQDGYVQNGKYSRKDFDINLQFSSAVNANNPLTSYNTTMGGDFNNNSQSLISYGRVGDSYVVKSRPMYYTIDAEFSQTTMESTLTLDGYAVKCEYKYKSFRTDNQFTGTGFDGGHVPACFFVNTLNRYQTYISNTPFTNAAVEDGVLPIHQSILILDRFAGLFHCHSMPTMNHCCFRFQ